MQYPYDIVNYFTKKDAFAIAAHFCKREKTETTTLESPLKIFDDKYSRFVMTIISDKKGISCNIPVSELPMMRSKTDYAANVMYSRKYSVAEQGEKLSPAYTLRFFSGKLKGKTPVEVLRENGDAGKTMLNKQYTWLKENLQAFPKNQEYMNAIIEAGKLNMEDILKPNQNAVPAPIPILEISVRPLIRKKREDGKCQCYEAYITWNFEKDYPVVAEIKNYYAPVIEKEDGTLNVQLSQKDKGTEIINTFYMSAKDWINALAEMEDIKKAFKQIHMANAFAIANKANADNRAAAGVNK